MKNLLKNKLTLVAMLIFTGCEFVLGQNTPYTTAPEGAIVLFDGTDFSHWVNCDSGQVRWKIVDGVMEVVHDTTWACPKINGTMTKQNFRDFQLHLEFRTPLTEHTNSGVYIQRRYELQVNNSYNVEPTPGMGGSIYRQKIPDVIVGKPKGEWESYDIVFRAARFDPDDRERKIENARITVIHNGIVIHNNAIIKDKTGVGYPEGIDPGPIMLQDHGPAVQYRNIWIIPNEPVETLPPDANH